MTEYNRIGKVRGSLNRRVRLTIPIVLN